MTQSVRLVDGVPAYTWTLATVLAAVFAVVGFVTLIGALLLVASGVSRGMDSAILPVVVLFLGLIGLPVCRAALPRVVARETAAGYTTVPFFAGELPLVDPRDGRELIAAGAQVPRSYRFSLRPARRHGPVGAVA
jgi:hypothetical protein